MPVLGVTASISYQVGSTFVPVPFVKSVNIPSISVSSIDTTSLSLSSYQKTFMPGCIDNGSVSFSCEYSESTFTTLHGMLRDINVWKVQTPVDEQVAVTFHAFITKIETPFEPDAEAMLSVELKVTGDVSLA